MIEAVWAWITENKATIGLLAGLGPTLWAVVQFILNKRAEANRQQFETYHSLIKNLVERDDPQQTMKLDRQIAIVFELRNFPKYFPVTRRILKGLTQDWAQYGPEGKRGRLHEEIELSIKHIDRKNYSFLSAEGLQKFWNAFPFRRSPN